MEKTHANPEAQWSPTPFSHGVSCGNMVFVGGQLPLDKDGDIVYPGDIVKQTHHVMESIKRVLADCGANLDDVVKINSYYIRQTDRKLWRDAFEARAGYFKFPGPASVGMPLPELSVPGVLIEIEVIAMVDAQ